MDKIDKLENDINVLREIINDYKKTSDKEKSKDLEKSVIDELKNQIKDLKSQIEVLNIDKQELICPSCENPVKDNFCEKCNARYDKEKNIWVLVKEVAKEMKKEEKFDKNMFFI